MKNEKKETIYGLDFVDFEELAEHIFCLFRIGISLIGASYFTYVLFDILYKGNFSCITISPKNSCNVEYLQTLETFMLKMIENVSHLFI